MAKADDQPAGQTLSSVREQREGVPVATFILSLILTAFLTGGGVFLWHEAVSKESLLILEQHIEDLRAQRDQVLGQRSGLQMALQALREEIRGLSGEPASLPEGGRPSGEWE